jgi:DNA-binding NarL/FixJ family response regulator
LGVMQRPATGPAASAAPTTVSATAPIRVAAVEDDARFLASLEMLLVHTDGFALAGSFATPADALAAMRAPAHDEGRDDGPGWDVVLMDIELPGMSGIECTRQIKAEHPGVQVVMLTVFEDRANLLQAICAGADGYLLKKTPAQLLEQLRAVVAGGSPLSAGVARAVIDVVRQVEAGPRAGASNVGFTPREREVLACLVQGMSYKGVAVLLDISIDTVRSHIRSIYRKLQVNNVAEAVGRTIRDRLL